MSPVRPKHNHAKVVSHLQQRRFTARDVLAKKFPHVQKKFESLNFDLSNLRRHSAKALATAALATGLMATTPAVDTVLQPSTEHREEPLSKQSLTEKLRMQLGRILPHEVGPLSPETEQEISKVIEQTLGVKAFAELDGNHLNTSFGYIGAEQHLPRFPGDTIEQHDALQFKGITANRGAFGYFARSREEMSEQDIMKEKYYVAVQTLYLPNWNQDHRFLKDWYAFRPVLVVNPANGKSVVAVVGDAGPAAWTGKHFGGSPEVMAHLELNRGKQKGAVLLYFLDETNQNLALGPVDEKQALHLAEK